jgi:Uma2 family endonuclease
MAVTQPREAPGRALRGPFTYKQLQHLREKTDDRYRYEIIAGELFLSPSPGSPHQLVGLPHQLVAAALHLFLGNHVRDHQLGVVLFAPLDVIFGDVDVVVPDMIYLTVEQLARAPDRGVEEPPTLVVEILSPSTQRRDRTKKMELYESMGVPHYWMVHPVQHWLEAYELRAGRYVLVTRAAGRQQFQPVLFPGLTIPLAELWPRQLGSRER